MAGLFQAETKEGPNQAVSVPQRNKVEKFRTRNKVENFRTKDVNPLKEVKVEAEDSPLQTRWVILPEKLVTATLRTLKNGKFMRFAINYTIY